MAMTTMAAALIAALLTTHAAHAQDNGDTLRQLAASGEFERIYARWFMSPHLKFPMGEPLKKLLKAPNNAPHY
jgi:hypothetical protein